MKTRTIPNNRDGIYELVSTHDPELDLIRFVASPVIAWHRDECGEWRAVSIEADVLAPFDDVLAVQSHGIIHNGMVRFRDGALPIDAHMKRVAEEENVIFELDCHAWYYHKNGVEVLSDKTPAGIKKVIDRVSSRRHVRFDSDDEPHEPGLVRRR
jgi:hypothetical protein